MDSVLKYEGYIRKIAFQLCKDASLVDDVCSVIRLSFLLATRSHDPTKSNIATYAEDYAIQDAKRFLKKERRRGLRGFNRRKVSIHFCELDDYGREEEDKEDLISSMWATIRESLSEREVMVLECKYIREMTLKEIALVIGCTFQRVAQIIEKAIFKLECVFKCSGPL